MCRNPAGDSESDPVVPVIPERETTVVSVVVLLKIGLAAYLGFLALFTAWLRPSFGAMFWSMLTGVLGGLAYSWFFFKARYTKRLLNDGVRPFWPAGCAPSSYAVCIE